MESVRKPVCLTSIAMLIVAFLLGSLTVAPVAASAILYTPINTTIPVESGQTFNLSFLMQFDNLTVDGYFSATICWENNGTENLNFTYLGYSITPLPWSGSINESIKKERPYGAPPGYYNYTVSISETYGEANNGIFWVNLTMGAYGVKDGVLIPHLTGEYNITVIKVRCYENVTAEKSVGPGGVTINVTGYTDVAVTAVKAFCPKESLDPVTAGYPSWTIDVNVTVRNLGTLTATVTATANYGNATGRYIIGTSTSFILAPGVDKTINFKWTPTAAVQQKVVYTISGNVSIPPGDINTANNFLADGTYHLKRLGDASGDNFVDVTDLVILGLNWFKPVPPAYAQADFSFDAFIDVTDLVILGLNWYKGC